MATPAERMQEIANRGIQDKLSPEKKARFDEAVKRGLIKMPDEGSFVDKVVGVGETALSIASSVVAEPVAGVAGIVQSLNPYGS